MNVSVCRDAESFSIQECASDNASSNPHRGFRSSLSDGDHLADDGRHHDDQSHGAEPVTQ